MSASPTAKDTPRVVQAPPPEGAHHHSLTDLLPVITKNGSNDRYKVACSERLEGGGEEDGEGAGADDAEDRGGGDPEVTLVLVTVGLELLGGVDGGVLVDVSLAVAEAELVHVAGLAVELVALALVAERRKVQGEREGRKAACQRKK